MKGEVERTTFDYFDTFVIIVQPCHVALVPRFGPICWLWLDLEANFHCGFSLVEMMYY